MSNEEAEKYKAQGNEAFKDGRYDDAIKAYNKAITLDPANATYYSNRAGAWSSKGNHDSALADANRCISNDPKFMKGYSRKGKALFDLNQWDEAEAAFKEGLHVDPNNDACSKGILDITAARQRARSSSSQSRGSSGGGGGGSSGGGFAGLVSQVAEKFKKGGRMQMYLVMMVGYFLFTNLTGRGSKRSKAASDEQGPLTDDDDVAPEVATVTTSRRFTQVADMWLSHLQTDAKSDTLLLFLHRTSSSAEAEYGAALPRIAKVLPPRSISLLAPDRPCHGYSPCPAEGEPEDPTQWVNRLLGTQKLRPKRLALVSAGRESASMALALARSRSEVTQLLLLSPRLAAPRHTSMSKAAEVHQWLAEHSTLSSAQAAADAARWAAATGKEDSSSAAQALDVTKLPQDCKVSILYGEDDEEDEDLRTALDSAGIEAKVRHPAGDDALLDILADEVRQALAPESTGVEMED